MWFQQTGLVLETSHDEKIAFSLTILSIRGVTPFHIYLLFLTRTACNPHDFMVKNGFFFFGLCVKNFTFLRRSVQKFANFAPSGGMFWSEWHYKICRRPKLTLNNHTPNFLLLNPCSTACSENERFLAKCQPLAVSSLGKTHSQPSQLVALGSILILSFHLRLVLPRSFFSWEFTTKTLNYVNLIIPSYFLRPLPISFSLVHYSKKNYFQH